MGKHSAGVEYVVSSWHVLPIDLVLTALPRMTLESCGIYASPIYRHYSGHRHNGGETYHGELL